MIDVSPTLVAKSDQLNADDLIDRTITIRITRVNVKEGEQPVALSYEGDNGKPYKPGKSMLRVLAHAWKKDAGVWVGRSLTLYRDPSIMFGGLAVGGIRISHMSDISRDMTVALTATRGQKKAFTVRPLKVDQPAPRQAQQQAAQAPDDAELASLCTMGDEAAERGTDTYTVWWTGLTKEARKSLGADRHAAWKAKAADADVAIASDPDLGNFPGDDDPLAQARDAISTARGTHD